MCHYFRDCNGLPILCAGEEVYDLGEEEQPSATEPEHSTVEPLYNEVLGTMKITLLYQVSHYIRVKN